MSGSPPRPGVRETPLVGRERELTALRERLDQARAGGGGIILLAGEPGIGKTRLLEEAARMARGHGIAAHWGRCWEGQSAPAFWPWVQTLRSIVRALPDDAIRDGLGSLATDIARLIPDLRVRLPDLPAVPDSGPEVIRFRVWDAVAAFLLAVARRDRRGLLLLLDDLHWADESSLSLLRFLAPVLADAPLLLVGTYREGEAPDDWPLAATLDALRRERTVTVTTVRGLAPEDVARLIGVIAGNPTPALVTLSAADLHRRTDGNPFFVSQIVQHLGESAGPGGADFDQPLSAGAVTLPEGVRAVIRRRLARLSPACREALTLAAVVGQEFASELVGRALADAPEGEGHDALERLEQAELHRLVEPVPGFIGRFRFVHALVRETLYEDLSTAGRVRLHRRVGEALEALAADPASYLTELAHHFGQALPTGDVDRAVSYARRAADAARAATAIEEAMRWYASALAASEQRRPPDDRERCDLALSLAEMHGWTMDVTARERCRHAFGLADELGDAERMARAALALGLSLQDWVGDDAELVGMLRRADEGLIERTPLKAEVMARLASALGFTAGTPRPDLAIPLARASLEMGRAVADGATMARVSFWAYHALRAESDVTAVLDEGIERGEAAQEPIFTPTLRQRRMLHDLARGEIARFDAELERWLGFIARYPSLRASAGFDSARIMRLMLDGRFGAARLLIEEAEGAARRLGNAALHGMMRQLRFSVDREGDAHAVWEPALRRAAERGGTPWWRCVLPLLLADLGRLEEARAAFDAVAVDGFMAVAAHPYGVSCLAPLAEACAAIDDRERADALHCLILPYDGEALLFGDMFHGAAARYLGLLAATAARGGRGRPAWDGAARRHFEDAIAWNARVGARPQLAWTRHDYARFLMAASQDDGRAGRPSPRALLTDARAAAIELGMTRLAGRCAAILARPGRGRTKLPPAGLSARELEVLRRLAAGESNQAIAAALVISARTVDHHVASIYRKLGVTASAHPRVDAVAYALRHGLAPA